MVESEFCGGRGEVLVKGSGNGEGKRRGNLPGEYTPFPPFDWDEAMIISSVLLIPSIPSLRNIGYQILNPFSNKH